MMTRQEFLSLVERLANAAAGCINLDREALREAMGFDATQTELVDCINAGAQGDENHVAACIARLDTALDDLQRERSHRLAGSGIPPALFGEAA